MTYTVHHGDCLDVMRTMADASVDAVICDPPYGLGEPASKGKTDSVFRRLVNVCFPDLNQLDPEFAQQVDLSAVSLDGTDLCRRKIGMVIDAWVRMPERAIDLQRGTPSREPEVQARAVRASCGVSEADLPSEFDAQRGEFLGDYLLDLRDAGESSFCDSLGGRGAQLDAGGITLPVVATLLPGSHCPLAALAMGLHPFGSDDIWGADDASGSASRAAGVMARAGAIVPFMLRLDARGAAADLSPAGAAFEIDADGRRGCPKLVRADAAASRLASKFQPTVVRVIDRSTDRARPLYFHLWLHRAEFENAMGSLPSSGFMGKEWDHSVPGSPFWVEALRVAKPGAHLVAFGGTRTYHRLTCAIEDAGWEIRDCLMWLYGSGFPKSLNVAKAIDSGGGRPEDIRRMDMGDAYEPSGRGRANPDHGGGSAMNGATKPSEPKSDAARQWSGWGTALKPAWEPIILARKPLDGTVAANVQAHGTGAINVDGCRIGTGGQLTWSAPRAMGFGGGNVSSEYQTGSNAGRWPANVILSHLDECILQGVVSVSSKYSNQAKRGPGGVSTSGHVGQSGMTAHRPGHETVPDWRCAPGCPVAMLDAQSNNASLFFYCPKTSTAERDAGIPEGAQKAGQDPTRIEGRPGSDNPRSRGAKARLNSHPTVKPTDLMRWLCRLVTLPGGLILDPFMGSGSTGVAALLEGFRFVGIDRDAEYVEIARHRLKDAGRQPGLFDMEKSA